MNYSLIFDREKGIKKLRNEVYVILSGLNAVSFLIVHDFYLYLTVRKLCENAFFILKMPLLGSKTCWFKINHKLQ